jgi:hypothetical protein
MWLSLFVAAMLGISGIILLFFIESLSGYAGDSSMIPGCLIITLTVMTCIFTACMAVKLDVVNLILK